MGTRVMMIQGPYKSEGTAIMAVKSWGYVFWRRLIFKRGYQYASSTGFANVFQREDNRWYIEVKP